MTPVPPSRDGLPRTALRLLLVVAGLVVLLVVLVAGCGSAVPTAPPVPATTPPTITPTTPAPSPTTAPPSTTPAPPSTSARATPERTAPRAAPAPAPARPPAPTTVVPFWPAGSAAAAARLQHDVDGGQQPWTLDPVAVATSYAGAELGYRNPGVFPLRPGVVDVQDGRSRAEATITLTQPTRRGDGGIWVVTGLQRR